MKTTNKQSINYFFHAKGSTAELVTQLQIASEIGYLDEEKFRSLSEKCDKISRMLMRLLQARK